MIKNTDKDFSKLVDENIALEKKLEEQAEYTLQVLNEKNELVDKVILYSKQMVATMEQLKIAMDYLKKIGEIYGPKNPEISKTVNLAIQDILLKGGE